MLETQPSIVSACPACGGSELQWRLERKSGQKYLEGRSFVWTCRRCQHTWRAPVYPLSDVDDRDDAPADEDGGDSTTTS